MAIFFILIVYFAIVQTCGTKAYILVLLLNKPTLVQSALGAQRNAGWYL